MKSTKGNPARAGAPAGADDNQPGGGLAAGKAGELPARSPAQTERVYLEAANMLLADATGRGTLHILADVLARTLAGIGYQNGPGAAGDIQRRLGQHLVDLALAGEAQREADEEKSAGRKPN